MHSLSGKTALITGGTSGIGLVVAKNFVENGATVWLTGRREEGQAIAEAIGAKFHQCDAADETQVQATLDLVRETHGEIDLLVVNAGVAEDEGSIEAFSTDGARHIIDVNLLGTFLALKHAPRYMRDGGSIICTGSVAGSGFTHAGTGVYAASKAGVAYLSRTAAIELAPRNIRVNCVCPAVIAGTGMMIEDDGGPESKFMGALTALGRMGRPDEVVGAYNFLASDSASFITGQEIRIDGGATAGIGLPVFAALSGDMA